MPAQNVLLLWTLEHECQFKSYAPSNRLYMAVHNHKKYYQNFTVISHLRKLDEGQSFPQNANPSCWLMKYLFFFDTFKISLTNHTISSWMLSLSKRIWVVFVALLAVRNHWVSVFDPSWFGVVYARNECILYWLIDHCTTLIFSANRYSDWNKTSKTEQTKSTQLSTKMTTNY